MDRDRLRRHWCASLACAIVFVTVGATSSTAAVITLSGTDFSGPTANTGGSIVVTITDIVGGVDLTVENNLVDSGAYLDDLYLNTTLAPLAAASGSCILCSDVNSVTPVFSFGSNAFQADGDGLYDILIDFSNTNSGGTRLTPSESVSLRILSTTAGFNAASFASISAPAGGHGPFQAAAHIASLPDGQSDWIAGTTQITSVPEPASLLLVATGLFGSARQLARKRRKGNHQG